MARARNKTVVSQRDVRQIPSFVHSEFQPKTYCMWCRNSGTQYVCQRECSVSPILNQDNYNDLTTEWTNFKYRGEGWSPASGPCCDDCLDAAFNRKQSPWAHRQEVITSEPQASCREQSKGVKVFVVYSWTLLCNWLSRVRQNLLPSQRKTDQWQGVEFEAEGFLEVRIVLSRHGAIQHMEIDFPSDITISVLKLELATLIDVPPDAQLWFYQAELIDETKTLDELRVDIGAIIEVKCVN